MEHECIASYVLILLKTEVFQSDFSFQKKVTLIGFMISPKLLLKHIQYVCMWDGVEREREKGENKHTKNLKLWNVLIRKVTL